MTSHIKAINDCKEDLSIIKEKVNNMEKNIEEIICCLKGSQDVFKEWEKSIEKINKENVEKIKEVKSKSWFWD